MHCRRSLRVPHHPHRCIAGAACVAPHHQHRYIADTASVAPHHQHRYIADTACVAPPTPPVHCRHSLRCTTHPHRCIAGVACVAPPTPPVHCRHSLRCTTHPHRYIADTACVAPPTPTGTLQTQPSCTTPQRQLGINDCRYLNISIWLLAVFLNSKKTSFNLFEDSCIIINHATTNTHFDRCIRHKQIIPFVAIKVVDPPFFKLFTAAKITSPRAISLGLPYNLILEIKKLVVTHNGRLLGSPASCWQVPP